jgi:hypothetical protein
MGHDRDRASGRRRPDERRRDDATPEPLRPEDRVLALQRSAGNRAVGALLARDTAKPEQEQKAAGARATLSGIGTIALVSVSFGANRSPPGADAGRGEDAKIREILVSSKHGEHSPKLSKALLDGTSMDVEVIVPSGKSTVRVKLKGAIVSAYSTSGDGDGAMESWTLDFQSMEHTVEGE